MKFHLKRGENVWQRNLTHQKHHKPFFCWVSNEKVGRLLSRYMFFLNFLSIYFQFKNICRRPTITSSYYVKTDTNYIRNKSLQLQKRISIVFHIFDSNLQKEWSHKTLHHTWTPPNISLKISLQRNDIFLIKFSKIKHTCENYLT